MSDGGFRGEREARALFHEERDRFRNDGKLSGERRQQGEGDAEDGGVHQRKRHGKNMGIKSLKWI